MTTNNFAPDWVSPPGETISDLMEVKKVSKSRLAEKLDRNLEDLAALLRGEEQINYSTATVLASVFGVSATFWINREEQYRKDWERLNPESWLSELPVSDMKRLGWIEKKSVHDCLRFFGVPTVVRWKALYDSLLPLVAFRTSPTFEADKAATAAWLRRGEIEGEALEGCDWDPTKFRDALKDIRGLSRKADPRIFIPRLKEVCARCGVAVSVVPAPTGCRASGATRMINRKRALILLSFRYLSDDHFWFSFFHEAGHLLLHPRTRLFLEGLSSTKEQEEREANEFAAKTLIPEISRDEFRHLPAQSKPVMKFARKIGISPGIVVGQLQHYGYIARSQLNYLKRRYRWDLA